MMIHVTCTTPVLHNEQQVNYIMVNELAEPSCPQWMETACFTNPSQQRCTRSWGFHTVQGGIVRGDTRFRPRLNRVVYKEGVLFRGWDRILSGCRWLHEPQPISNQPVRLGFPHRVDRYRPGGPPFSCFRPRFVRVVDVWKDS